MLTISRADAGRVQLRPTLLSAIDIAREAASLFEVLIEEKQQIITVDGDESATIYGDRVFLRQAVVNIIHNAVKFSPVGGVISVRVQADPDSLVRIEITDNGPGIAANHVDRIFDRFYRVDESRTRDTGGAGLGLSIAQWTVRMHGGQIRVQTTPGNGSTFQICLPSTLMSPTLVSERRAL